MSGEGPPGSEEFDRQIDWDNTVSTPLVGKGSPAPNIISPCDKHSTSENSNGYITFAVEGDPAPEVQWFKGFKDLSKEATGRYKFWTFGDDNTITLGCLKARTEDEGEYKVVLTNSHGEFEFEFKFYVTVEGGMDLRAMLMKRKVKQKKIVQKIIEWTEKPVDQEVQQGKCKEVQFTAQISEKDKKGKWYLRNAATLKDKRATDNGIELYKGDKFDWTFKDDTYTLIIRNPTVEEDGTYLLFVRELDMKTSAHLTVDAADPEFYWKKPLKTEEKGLTARPSKLVCYLNMAGAKIQWTKNGSPIVFDKRVECEVKSEKVSLIFRTCELDDSAQYSCQILKFVKPGEQEQTDSCLLVEEYPHTFTSKLKGQTVVEHDRAEFEIDVEASDAEVVWFKNGKKINPEQDPRFEIIVDGKKRKLVLKDAHLEDTGDITCKTNTDSSSCHLLVKHENMFLKGLDQFTDGVEREECVFTVHVKDPGAPVDFYFKGQKISKSDNRCMYSNIGDGKHQLVVHGLKMEDMGLVEARTPSNRGNGVVTSSTTLDVIKGEERPEIGDTGPVTGVAYKDCNWNVPYKISGKIQSKMEIIVIKDGKELKLGQDINVSITNNQGEDRRDINVNIMDKPTPPQVCKVTDVFHDNCQVNWKEPIDDGGTEITRYIIEALNTTLGNDWHQVAEAKPSERKMYIDGLVNKNKYRFRVLAINKIGKSMPCEMNGDDILIKDPWDEPSQPGRPNILDWGPGHCDLSWEPPESDGGAPITHYIIEKKEKSMAMWEEGRVMKVEECMFSQGKFHGTCPVLVEGNEYMFRIKAVNIGSKGQWNYSIPSEPSDTMIAKIRYIKAFLHDPGMYDIEIKKGQCFRYDIWFGGEPPPAVTWERKDGIINSETDPARITLELMAKKKVYCERNTVLTVKKADREKDSGKYTIRLTCEGGNFQASGFVNVLDVPWKPKNLVPGEVRAEHVKLNWDKPDDDGGTPLLRYLVKVMDLEYNQWITVCEVNAPTTNCTVDNLKPGHLYKFQVIAINKEGESLPAITKDPVCAENPYKPPSEPREPGIVDFDNKSITLRWNKPKEDGGRPITHFIIQKKDQFGGWFDALITNDDNCSATIDDLEARVPGLSEGKWYQFRIVAVNKAGESWPSYETKPHLCRHKNLSPNIEKGSGGSKSVKVNRLTCWRINVKGEPPPEFTWFKDGQPIHTDDKYLIERMEYQGGATAVLQILKTQMEDAGTYRLQANNRNGSDKVDVDLIVLESQHDTECDMFKNASLDCNCTASFRIKIAGGSIVKLQNSEFRPKNL